VRASILSIRGLTLIAALLATACGGGSSDGVSSATDAAPTANTITTAPDEGSIDLPNLGPHEELVEIDGWLQTDIQSLEELRGSVIVVQFWTFGCVNCRNTLENLRALHAEYGAESFEIVGIHSPEFVYEKDPGAVADAATELGVSWPIALDTERRTFRRWQGSPAYWPRTYVLDRDGIVRFDHIGEGAYEELNEAVAVLLG